MLEAGIIEPSTSDMASPIVCVMKGPDGKGRVQLAVDYRHVNQHSAGDQFPTPDVQDVLQHVGGPDLFVALMPLAGITNYPSRKKVAPPPPLFRIPVCSNFEE